MVGSRLRAALRQGSRAPAVVLAVCPHKVEGTAQLCAGGLDLTDWPVKGNLVGPQASGWKPEQRVVLRRLACDGLGFEFVRVDLCFRGRTDPVCDILQPKLNRQRIEVVVKPPPRWKSDGPVNQPL